MLKSLKFFRIILSGAILLSVLFACADNEIKTETYNASVDSLRFEGEIHLRNIKQLTFGGNNAEAYCSFDNKQLVFQSDWADINSQGCDQIFKMNVDGTSFEDGEKYKLISTGKGRTTCSYFLKDGRIVYA